MNMEFLENVIKRVNELIEPQRERMLRSFQETLREIKFRNNASEWEINRSIEEAIARFVSSLFEVVTDAISSVVTIRNVALSERQLEDIFNSIRPNIDDLRTFVYQNAHGLAIPTGVGVGIAIDDAYRQSNALGVAKVKYGASSG